MADMTYAEAYSAIQDGACVARDGWQPGRHVFWVTADCWDLRRLNLSQAAARLSPFACDLVPAGDGVGAVCVPFQPSDADRAAADWHLVVP